MMYLLWRIEAAPPTECRRQFWCTNVSRLMPQCLLQRVKHETLVSMCLTKALDALKCQLSEERHVRYSGCKHWCGFLDEIYSDTMVRMHDAHQPSFDGGFNTGTA